jgi:hypothetical protein
MSASLPYASRELLRAMERVIPWAQLARTLLPTFLSWTMMISSAKFRFKEAARQAAKDWMGGDPKTCAWAVIQRRSQQDGMGRYVKIVRYCRTVGKETANGGN